MDRNFASPLIFCAILLFSPLAVMAVTIDWSPVGNPGNANDPATGKLYGGVGYSYNIGTYDVTNSQYVEMLNAKDPTGANTLGLYNSTMSNPTYGGINYSSDAVNGNRYSVISGNGNHPVNYVTWYDTVRFANWLNNGQGSGDTETGAYALLGGTPTPTNGDSILRNARATVFLPSENEWYKAAYYNPGTNSYFEYPTSSNTTPTASSPTVLPNHANYDNAVGNMTEVGAYSETLSPYGAFDMGGDVLQWTEGTPSDLFKATRGDSFDVDSVPLLSSGGSFTFVTSEFSDIGFRVASIAVPEPSSLVLAACGLIGLAVRGYQRRKRAIRVRFEPVSILGSDKTRGVLVSRVKALLILAVIVLLVAYAAIPSFATQLFDSSGTASYRDGYTGSDKYAGTVGLEFVVRDQAIEVTGLGYFDGPNSNGGTIGDGLQSTHQVGIWGPGQQLVASVSVGAGSILVGSFRYVTLETPLILPAGSGYSFGGQVSTADLTGSGDVFRNDADAATISADAKSAIFYYGGLYTDAPDGNPTLSNGVFREPHEDGGAWFLGPNMQFNVVPEPASCVLFGLGAIGLYTVARRRRAEVSKEGNR